MSMPAHFTTLSTALSQGMEEMPENAKSVSTCRRTTFRDKLWVYKNQVVLCTLVTLVYFSGIGYTM